MTEEERDRFLSEPRYGILTLLRTDGSPIAVPVWFDWTGEVVRMFTSVVSAKMERLRADPRASLLVAWVAFDGVVSIHEDGGIELAERLAPRYWDLSDPDRQRTLESWREAAAAFRILELKPARIRTYRDEVPAA